MVHYYTYFVFTFTFPDMYLCDIGAVFVCDKGAGEHRECQNPLLFGDLDRRQWQIESPQRNTRRGLRLVKARAADRPPADRSSLCVLMPTWGNCDRTPPIGSVVVCTMPI